MKKFFAALMLLSAAMLAHAEEFPEGTTTPTSAELRQFLDGKVFTPKYANGVGLRYDFAADDARRTRARSQAVLLDPLNWRTVIHAHMPHR